MNAQHPLARLERLARIRESGASSGAEFECENGRLIQRGAGPAQIANDHNGQSSALVAAAEQRDGKPRWPHWLMVCLVLAGGGGSALAEASQIQPQRAAASSTSAAESSTSVPVREAGSNSGQSGIRALPEQRQVDLAFDAVFGPGDREIRLQEDAVYRYAHGKLIWADFGPVLIAEGSGEPSPLVNGTLGLFYLREIAGAKFEEVRRWPDAVAGGTMGNPPRWEIRSDIADRPVIEATGGGVWQGYGCDTTTLTELTTEGPKLLATFASGYSSEGAEGDAGQIYDGTIVNVVRGRSFDVRFTGTRTLTEHYVRKGAEYVRVPGKEEEMNESVIPTC